MVLLLTPSFGNESHPCAGLNAYNAERPPATQAYVWLNWFCSVATWILAVIGICGTFYYRNNPQFAKVRPVSISLLTLAAINSYAAAGFVAVPLQAPSIVPIILYPTAVSWIMSGIALRALTISIEFHLAQLVHRMHGVVQQGNNAKVLDEDMSVSESAPPLSQVSHILRTDWHGLLLLFQLTLGVKEIGAMELKQLVLSRRMMLWYALVVTFPGTLGSLLVLAAVPQTRNQCALQCQDVFLELPILLIVLIVFYCTVITHCVLVAYRNVGWDDKGCIREMLLIPTTVGFPCAVGWLIVVLDPNDWGYTREFNWHLLCFIPGCWYWWVCFGSQFYRAQTISRKIRAQRNDSQTSGVSTVNMTKACEGNAELKREFRDFAAQHYCTELVLFLDDCRAYKLMFFDKSENWRTSKAKLLIKTYIESNSDLEINISGELKKSILNQYYQQQHHAALADDRLFDEAVQEVESMVQHGVWAHFLVKQRECGGSRVLSMITAKV